MKLGHSRWRKEIECEPPTSKSCRVTYFLYLSSCRDACMGSMRQVIMPQCSIHILFVRKTYLISCTISHTDGMDSSDTVSLQLENWRLSVNNESPPQPVPQVTQRIF